MLKFIKRPLSSLLVFGTWCVAVPALFADEVADAASPALAARVNGIEITRAEVDAQIQNVLAQFQGQLPPEQLEPIRQQVAENVMEQLITKALLDQQVKAENIEIGEAEVEEAIANIRRQIPPGASLEQQLEMMGITVQEMRDQIQEGLAIEKLLESKVAADVEPSEEEITAFYEEHRETYFTRPESAQASHILLDTREAADDAARQAIREKLEGIRTAILEGADFAEKAGEHSSCPSGQQGGSLGEFGRGQMVPAFEEAAFSQELDKVGPVIETQFGYHIVLVTARSEAGEISLEETRDDIAQYLGNQKREQAVEDYITQLRENAEVEIIPGQ